MSDDFVSLHTHTEFSMLDGYQSVTKMTERVAEIGQPAIAMTDHGSCFGAYDFVKAAHDAGIKPIVGMEAYVAPELRTLRKVVVWGDILEEGKKPKPSPKYYTHMTLLALNATGLRNLFRMHELSYTTGLYQKPRIDLDLLRRYNEGLVATTGCAGGAIPTLLRLGLRDRAKNALYALRDIFGDRLYVEVMTHGMDWEDAILASLLELADDTHTPLVATNDSHYSLAAEAPIHDALLCAQTHTTVATVDRMRFGGSGYHLRSRMEMDVLGLPHDALDNTLKIASLVGAYEDIFDHKNLMPKAVLL